MNIGIGDALLRVLQGDKQCFKCKVYKAGTEFHKNKGTIDGLRSNCKNCHNTLKRERYAEDPGHTLKREQLYRYKMTSSVFSTLKKKQGGKCAICKIDLVRIYIDHNHKCCPGQRKTCGKCVRGLLCGRCNAMLGQARDSAVILRNASDYLRSYAL